jgi:hypothetical protein
LICKATRKVGQFGGNEARHGQDIFDFSGQFSCI